MKNISILILLTLTIISCKKNSDKEAEADPSATRTEIINNLGSNVILATYVDMNKGADELVVAIANLKQNKTDQSLLEAQNKWYAVRNAWEKSEGFLFGPVSVDNIDPRIDTWPVNYASLDSVLSSNSTFTPEYIDQLEDALRGFHPIEYLLFGLNKSRKASELTSRQIEYLESLANNLKSLTNQTVTSWNATFLKDFTNPGNQTYPTQLAVFEELVNAMTGICDEVANGKIAEPFHAQDPSLEESPFALNSLTDFQNNISSVSNIYYGSYTNDGKGIEDFVKIYNLSLDQKIKTRIQQAQQSLSNLKGPFGESISKESNQVQNAIDAINALGNTLEDELLPLIQLHIK